MTARIPRSSQAKRAPELIERRMLSPGVGVGAGRRSGAMAAITARKLTVLIANASP